MLNDVPSDSEEIEDTPNGSFLVEATIRGEKIIYSSRPDKNERLVFAKNMRHLLKMQNRFKYPKYSVYATNEFACGGMIIKIINNDHKKFDAPRYSISGKKLEQCQGQHPFPDIYYKEIDINRKDSFELPQYKEFDEYIKKFINKKDFYKSKNLMYKLGVLMYGPPGNGKTSYFRYLINNDILPKDATVIWTESIPNRDTIETLRKVKGLKVFIFEELVTSVVTPSQIQRFLKFMDGEDSLDNAIYFATTNHPEALPANIIDRPGRFDYMIEVNNPDRETREVILKEYFGDKFEESMIGQSEGLSNADIREVFLLSVVQELSFAKATSKLKNHKENVKNSFQKYRKMGLHDD